jgi:hypothetical protein
MQTPIEHSIPFDKTTLAGYLHPDYAESLAEFGTPRHLPRCGGWLLERQIPDTPYRDAMGCYPLFVCQDWSQLQLDLVNFEYNWVSLALVTDPFAEVDLTYLQHYFNIFILFKQHFIIDFCQPINEIISSHHRYYMRKALQQISVEVCSDPIQYLDEWTANYATLVERHNINGIQAFSRRAFIKQLTIPGMMMVRAISQGVTVGLNLWYIQEETAYDHLTACSGLGYQLRASYALKGYSIQYLADKVSRIDLGGGAGLNREGKDGLSKFKQGWSNGVRSVYFCGKIFDHKKYTEITQSKGVSTTNYFPAYRQGEFT